jgi:GxxExxY protein
MPREPSAEIDRLARKVIGVAIEVHKELGPGFLESIYEEAMFIALRDRGLSASRQVTMPISFRGTTIGDHRLDLLVEDELVVELKAVETLLQIHAAQLHSYLKAGAFELGLLINFNVPLLKQGGLRRVILWQSIASISNVHVPVPGST